MASPTTHAREATVDQLMTRKVVTLDSQQSVPLAGELMRLHRIRHIPVVRDKQLVGLVTHRDLLEAQISALTGLSQDYRSEAQLSIPVSKIMRTQLWTVTPETPALEAGQIMIDHAFGCLPVVRDGQLVGILTEADFLRLLLTIFAEHRQSHASTSPG